MYDFFVNLFYGNKCSSQKKMQEQLNRKLLNWRFSLIPKHSAHYNQCIAYDFDHQDM